MLSHRIDFRAVAGSRRPTIALSSKSRRESEAIPLLFPNFSAPLYPNVSERGNGAMSRSAHFEQNKGILLYFRSRSESVIVIFANYRSMLLRLKSFNIKTLHACLSLLHAVKASHPRVVRSPSLGSGCKYNKNFGR